MTKVEQEGEDTEHDKYNYGREDKRVNNDSVDEYDKFEREEECDVEEDADNERYKDESVEYDKQIQAVPEVRRTTRRFNEETRAYIVLELAKCFAVILGANQKDTVNGGDLVELKDLLIEWGTSCRVGEKTIWFEALGECVHVVFLTGSGEENVKIFWKFTQSMLEKADDGRFCETFRVIAAKCIVDGLSKGAHFAWFNKAHFEEYSVSIVKFLSAKVSEYLGCLDCGRGTDGLMKRRAYDFSSTILHCMKAFKQWLNFTRKSHGSEKRLEDVFEELYSVAIKTIEAHQHERGNAETTVRLVASTSAVISEAALTLGNMIRRFALLGRDQLFNKCRKLMERSIQMVYENPTVNFQLYQLILAIVCSVETMEEDSGTYILKLMLSYRAKGREFRLLTDLVEAVDKYSYEGMPTGVHADVFRAQLELLNVVPKTPLLYSQMNKLKGVDPLMKIYFDFGEADGNTNQQHCSIVASCAKAVANFTRERRLSPDTNQYSAIYRAQLSPLLEYTLRVLPSYKLYPPAQCQLFGVVTSVVFKMRPQPQPDLTRILECVFLALQGEPNLSLFHHALQSVNSAIQLSIQAKRIGDVMKPLLEGGICSLLFRAFEVEVELLGSLQIETDIGTPGLTTLMFLAIHGGGVKSSLRSDAIRPLVAYLNFIRDELSNERLQLLCSWSKAVGGLAWGEGSDEFKTVIDCRCMDTLFGLLQSLESWNPHKDTGDAYYRTYECVQCILYGLNERLLQCSEAIVKITEGIIDNQNSSLQMEDKALKFLKQIKGANPRDDLLITIEQVRVKLEAQMKNRQAWLHCGSTS